MLLIFSFEEDGTVSTFHPDGTKTKRLASKISSERCDGSKVSLVNNDSFAWISKDYTVKIVHYSFSDMK